MTVTDYPDKDDDDNGSGDEWMTVRNVVVRPVPYLDDDGDLDDDDENYLDGLSAY